MIEDEWPKISCERNPEVKRRERSLSLRCLGDAENYIRVLKLKRWVQKVNNK
jgi:hypothetical protein